MRKILSLLLTKEDYACLDLLQDGGSQIYGDGQKTGAGGSGTACIAVMTLGYGLNLLKSAKAQRILVVATGALQSTI